MYNKKNAIAAAGKTRQLRTTSNEGKYEAENNIVKFPIEITRCSKMTLLQISIKYSKLLRIFNKTGGIFALLPVPSGS